MSAPLLAATEIRHDSAVESGRENAIQYWGGGLGAFIPAATADHPWRVVIVRSWRGRFRPDDSDFPPQCHPPPPRTP